MIDVVAFAAQTPCQQGCLFQTRSNQTIDLTIDFGAFTNGVDVFGAGLQVSGHADTAPHSNACIARQFNVRLDTRGNDQGIAGQRTAITQNQAFDFARPINGHHRGIQFYLYAVVIEAASKRRGGGLIQLAVHQPGRVVHQSHIRRQAAHCAGGFDTQQATTEYNGMTAGDATRQQGSGIFHITEGEHAAEAGAGNIGDVRAGAGGQHQVVVKTHHTLIVGNTATLGVDAGDAGVPVGEQAR